LLRRPGETTIDERAKKMARMVEFIRDGLRTKTYDQFVSSFSNPGNEPDGSERDARRLRFHLQFSPTCWYEAIAEYPSNGTPYFHLEGGGDDWGVIISGDAVADHRIGVDFFVPTGSRPGRAARGMEHALRKMPGWSRASDIELAAFATGRHLL
jgi:hypothetical protein